MNVVEIIYSICVSSVLRFFFYLIEKEAQNSIISDKRKFSWYLLKLCSDNINRKDALFALFQRVNYMYYFFLVTV